MAMSGNVRSLNGAAPAGRTPSANRILRYKTNRDGLARSCLLSSSSRFLPFSGSDTRPLPLPILVHAPDDRLIAHLVALAGAHIALVDAAAHKTAPDAADCDA